MRGIKHEEDEGVPNISEVQSNGCVTVIGPIVFENELFETSKVCT